jgi:hypothetical protein
MKVTVVADADGTVVAAAYTAPDMRDDAGQGSAIAPGPGQSTHEVDAPEELVDAIRQDRFAEAVFRFSLAKEGDAATLVRRQDPDQAAG